MKANSATSPYIPRALLSDGSDGVNPSIVILSMGKFDIMFTLNGLGYLTLLAALFLESCRQGQPAAGPVWFDRLYHSCDHRLDISWDMTWWLGWLTN